MTAFLQIGYNKIPRLATSIVATCKTTGGGGIALGPNNNAVENLFYGGSTIYWRNSDTQGIGQSIFTLTIPSELSAESVNYVAIRGLNLLFKNTPGNVSVEVRGSTDNFSASDVQLGIATGLTSSSLVGPFLEDYILTFTASATYRYFRVLITSTNSVTHRFRKIYLGTLFDFSGKSPVYPYSPGYGNNGTPFTSDAGSIFKTSMGRRPREMNFQWTNITDADRIIFDKQIKQFLSDFPIFLYEHTSSDHNPLNGDRLVFGWSDASVETKEWKNNNQISLSFREDIVG